MTPADPPFLPTNGVAFDRTVDRRRVTDGSHIPFAEPAGPQRSAIHTVRDVRPGSKSRAPTNFGFKSAFFAHWPRRGSQISLGRPSRISLDLHTLCPAPVDNESQKLRRSRALELATSAGLSLVLLAACGTFGSAIRSPAQPGSPAIDNELDAVACATPTHCVAVGRSHSYGPFVYRTLIEDSTGGAWAIVSSPSSHSGVGSRLNDVTCPSANLCIAVGFNQDAGSTPTTLIEQNNGGGWTIVPSPNPTSFGAPYGVLNAVTCVSAVDCIAVGDYDSDSGLPQPLIEEDRGNGWVIVPSQGTATGDRLLDVDCATAASCFAVGSAGDQTGELIVQRTDDGDWAIVYHTVAPPCPSGTTCIRVGYLDDVTCSGADICIAAPGSLEYAGGRWSEAGAGSAAGMLPSRLTCRPVDCIGAASLPAGGIVIEQGSPESWSPLATLTLNGADRYQLVAADIACAGRHCVVVGRKYVGGVAMASGPSETLIAEGQGSQWAIVRSPNVTGNLGTAPTAH